jgi:hypothetical protein
MPGPLRAVSVLAAASAVRAAAPATITLDMAPINVVAPTYLSYNLDPSCNRGFHVTNFGNANLVAAGYFLQPARLRFGGSGADELVYSLTPGAPECADIPQPPPPRTPGCDYVTAGCLNATHAASLYDFATAAHAELVFGVAFNFTASCAGAEWDASNAARLLTWLKETGRSSSFELGNEVNNAGPCTPPAKQAAALTTFAGMVAASSNPAARLVGPDTGYLNPEPYITSFLGNLTPGTVSAVTHHVYLGLGRADFATTPDATATKLDKAIPEMDLFVANVAAHGSGAEPWAGEMGPIGGGDDGTCGTTSVCGTWASAIWYADDAALRSLKGYVQHNRQTLFGGAYGMTNSPTGAMALDATSPVIIAPDYFVSWTWKRTLGPSVLAANSSSRAVRAYAFAGRAPSPFAARAECADGVQLMLMNLGAAPAAVALPPVAATFAAWSLAPLGGDAFATAATLNGVPLPTTIDVATRDPATLLGALGVPPTRGAVADGLTLDGWAIAFVCLA